MAITQTDVQKLASLARINLTEAELNSFAKEIDSILGYIDQLNTVSAQITDTKTAVPQHRNQLRDDSADNTLSPQPEKLVTAAPGSEDGLVKVKKILAQ